MKIYNKSLIFVLLLSSLAAQCADDDATTTQGATQQPAVQGNSPASINENKARLNDLLTFIEKNNGYTVTKKTTNITGSLEVPTYWEGKPIIAIDDYAFYYCSSLTSVTIPPLVTSIGDYAFYYCSSLESITIPPSVTSIGAGAFRNCSSLTSVTIPPLVTSIGAGPSMTAAV